MQARSLDDLNSAGKDVLVRVDLNSPLDPTTGRLLDDRRIKLHVETVDALSDSAVTLLAHQSRPGKHDFTTLERHAERLGRLLGRPVTYVDDVFGSHARDTVREATPGDVVLLENVRFYSEEYIETAPEDAADTHLVRRLAPLFDAYVDDAFSAAHRSQPSLVGFPLRLPSYAGKLMERELDVLGGLEDAPEPVVYSLGGAKVADALGVVENVLEDGAADSVLASGVLGNLLLMADDVDVGPGTREFMEAEGHVELLDDARDVLGSYDEIVLPSDVAVEVEGERVEVSVDELPVDEQACDVGLETMVEYSGVLSNAGTAVVNGPPGVYEEPAFQRGTREVFRGAVEADMSVAGGGDTAAAVETFDVHGFDHVSSGGGASTAVLSGESLPAVEALERSREM
ncbi:MAG: phosphoglycerate kinase [Halobacteriota archaeon]